MFTGIIQNQAKVLKYSVSGGQIHFTFGFVRMEKRKVETGESIAVDGVCLTAVKGSARQFEADVVRETLAVTTLGFLKEGSVVNIERALRKGDSMGGHFVTGHVDGRGKILEIERQGKNFLYTFEAPAAVVPYLDVKGSITIDGISLTLQTVRKNRFQIALVPHTLKVTAFGRKTEGSLVNLEGDRLSRSSEKGSSPITVKMLRKHGF